MKLIKYDILKSDPEGSFIKETEEDQLQRRLKDESEKNKFNKNEAGDKETPQKSRPWHSALEITEIRPYLLLCGAVALKRNTLKDLNVTCVINATNELPDTPLPSSYIDNEGNTVNNEILYIRVGVDDKYDTDLSSWMDIISDTIHQVKLSGGKTLIHCMAGVSRSPTLCLAYLVKYEHYSLYDSYIMLKKLRNIIRPNSGLFGQLVEFEKRITDKQTVSMVFNEVAKTFIPHLYEKDYQRLLFNKYNRSITKI